MERSLRIAAVSLAGLYGALLLSVSGTMPAWVLLLSTLLASLCVYLSVVDFRYLRIPNVVNALILLTGVGAVALTDLSLLGPHALTAFAGFGVFWLIGEMLYRRTGTEYLGLGDAKLFGAGLMWVGPLGAPSALLLASLSALAFAVSRQRFKKTLRKQSVPFGPFLAFGIFMTWIFGPIA